MLVKLTKAILHLCWYSIAATIITIAVAVTLLRIFLPDIGRYRDDVQLFVSEHTGYPVEIRKIDARWDGWIPNLYLEDISVLDKQGTMPLVHFDEAFMELDPVASLQQRSLVPLQLKISGIDLSISRQEDGSIIVVESGTKLLTDNDDFNNQGLTDWLRRQKRIFIENANLSWIDQQQRYEPIRFNNASVELLNDLNEFRIIGAAQLEQAIGNASVNYQINIFGDILSADWSGTLNLNGNGFNPGEWLNKDSSSNLIIGKHQGDVSLKTKFKYAKLNQLVAHIRYDQFSLEGNETPFYLGNLDAKLDLLRKEDNKWIMDIQLKDLSTQNGIWKNPAARLEINKKRDIFKSGIHAKINHMKIDDLTGIVGQFLNPENIDFLQLINGGEVHKLDIQYEPGIDDRGQFSINADIENFNLSNHQDFTLSGLSAHLSHSDKHGTLEIASNDVSLTAKKLYDRTFAIDQIEGEFGWAVSEAKTIFNSEGINVQTENSPININGNIIYNKEDRDPVLDLNISSNNLHLKKVLSYFPLTTKKSVLNWLNNALLDGQIISANSVIKGPVSKFPYKNEEGTFKTEARIVDATIAYHNNWPPLEKVSVDIDIQGTKLIVKGDHGKIFNADMKNVVAIIPDLLAKKPILNVNGQVEGNSQDLIAYIEQSPLRKNASLQVPRNNNLEGPILIDIALMIPLQKKPLIDVKGDVDLLGNSIDSEKTGIQLKELKGNIKFTRDMIESKDLVASYFNQPISLQIGNIVGNKQQIILTGDMDKDFIKKQFNHYFPSNTDLINDYLDQLTGNSSWQARIELSPENESEQKLIVTSDFRGIEINMPTPLAKEKHTIFPVTLDTVLAKNSEQNLGLQLGNLLAAKLGFSKLDGTKLESLNIDFGGQLDTLKQKDGVLLNGKIDRLDLTDWLELIQKRSHQGIEKETSTYNDIQVDIEISQLELFNQHFSDVKLKINTPEKDWRIDVDSNDIKGTISIPSDNENIVLNLSRLKLEADQDEEKSIEIDPNQLPSIHAYVTSFQYGDIQLGEMYLETSKIDHGLSFDNILFQKENIEISAHGEWTKLNDKSESLFNIDLDTNELNTMLETFDYELTSIEEGKTDINIEAKWPGSPTDFQLENLDGSMSLIIYEGKVLNINPKAGRLFGLLSLQSLPRRLSLDFSDLFGKGLSFDRIEGAFTLEKGHAYTNDLLMKGPSADIAITGRTGLIAQDYDQLVTVTPQIADSLPVASALFGPIGIGVGTVIYFASELFKSLPSKIDKILQYQYTITGSWSDPVVEKFKQKEKASG